ncbi:MAG TPA: hypothetical protein VGH24_03750 [Solirubrobacteraceae bacterium]
MPAHVSRTVELTPDSDSRFRPGAYITDGEALYFVHRTHSGLVPDRLPMLLVEDCMTDTMLELEYAYVASFCTLVRPASGTEGLRDHASRAV